MFLSGNSEGAVVVSQLPVDAFGTLLRGRIIIGWPCELNFWNNDRARTASRAADGALRAVDEMTGADPFKALLAGGVDLPTLAVNGTADDFFAERDSIAASVADALGVPAEKRPTGDAQRTFEGLGLTHACVAVLDGGYHDPTVTHDDSLRALLLEMLQRPELIGRLDEHWAGKPMARLLRSASRGAGAARGVLTVRVGLDDASASDAHAEGRAAQGLATQARLRAFETRLAARVDVSRRGGHPDDSTALRVVLTELFDDINRARQRPVAWGAPSAAPNRASEARADAPGAWGERARRARAAAPTFAAGFVAGALAVVALRAARPGRA